MRGRGILKKDAHTSHTNKGLIRRQPQCLVTFLPVCAIRLQLASELVSNITQFNIAFEFQ